MQRFCLAEPQLTADDTDPPGYRAHTMRLGPLVGAARTGASLYELPPGEALCPYHYELGEEEWLLVLAGQPTVRTPEGDVRLGPLDGMFFPTGPGGAHAVRNDTDAPVRVLLWSEVRLPTATVYPDSDKVGVWTGAGNREDATYRIASQVDYYDGER